MIDSTNPDLARFFARGGRLIVKSGSSDYSVNPQIVESYYETVVAKLGQQQVDRQCATTCCPMPGTAATARA